MQPATAQDLSIQKRSILELIFSALSVNNVLIGMANRRSCIGLTLRVTFGLGERLRVALPRDYNPKDPDQSVNRYSGADLGVDMDKFAYFAISMVWRGAVHDWVMPDGIVRPHDALGSFVEPMRLYLLGETPLPPNTSVIVIAGSDDESRKVWTTPQAHVEADCLNLRFNAFGAFFRVMMGYRMWDMFRDYCCTSARKCIFYGSAKHRMPEIMQIFESVPHEKAP